MDNHYLCYACFLEINDKQNYDERVSHSGFGLQFHWICILQSVSQADYIFKPLKFEVLQWEKFA